MFDHTRYNSLILKSNEIIERVNFILLFVIIISLYVLLEYENFRHEIIDLFTNSLKNVFFLFISISIDLSSIKIKEV